MKGSAEVLASLQTIAASEAHINEQYRLDQLSLKFMGFKSLASKMDKFGDRSHCFRKIVVKRILFLGGAPDYQIGEVKERATVTGLYQEDMALELKLAQLCTAGIRTAVANQDEASAEKLRHIEERHEENIGWFEQQLALIAAFTEKNYLEEMI